MRAIALALLLTLHTAPASAAYNPVFCALVTGTLNIHWEAIGGPFAPCTGVEITNGTLAMAATGTVTMNGIAVTNPACIGVAAYTLTLSPDTTKLSGFDTANAVPMTLIRAPGQACFVGTWTLGADVYEAHISALAFPLIAVAIPTLSEWMLVLLGASLALAGGLKLRRRKE